MSTKKQRPLQPELPGITGEEVPCMSDDELKKFVVDFVSGQIFSSAHIAPGEDMLGMVFMPIAFGALNWSKTGLSRVGIVYEYLDKAGPRSVNGMPCFFSMHIMNIEDWKVALNAIKREEKRREDIEL